MALRLTVIGLALLFWWQGTASVGDVVFVLTAYGVIHAYLRDIGHHIDNFRRCVNDLDELVVVTWTYDPAPRHRSYELLAQAFELKKTAPSPA